MVVVALVHKQPHFLVLIKAI